MQKVTPNSNFSLTIHQATILTPVSPLTLSPQILLSYNNTQTQTKTQSDLLPIFNETFNFELLKGPLTLTLLNNPKFFKSSELGSCVIPVTKQSGWFDLLKNNKKTGSVRVTLIDDHSESLLLKDYQSKLTEAKAIQEEVKSLKKEYLRQTKKKKESLISGKSREFDDIENNDLTNRSYSVKQEMKEIVNRKALIKIQEEAVEKEKNKLKEAWNEIENEKKEMEEMIAKIKEGYQECQVAKFRSNLVNRISEYSKSRSGTPKSAKISSSRGSDFSLSNPRSDE